MNANRIIQRGVINGKRMVFNPTTNRWLREDTQTGKKFIRDANKLRLGPETTTRQLRGFRSLGVEHGIFNRETFVNDDLDNSNSDVARFANTLLSHKVENAERQYAVLRFLIDDGEGMEFRSVDVDSRQQIIDDIAKIAVYHFVKLGSDELFWNAELDFNFFKIVTKPPPGGGALRKPNPRNMTQRTHDYYKTFDYRSTLGGRNCFITICMQCSDAAGTKQCNTVRKDLKIDLNTNITLDQIPIFEEYFGLRINVLEDSITKTSTFFDHGGNCRTVVAVSKNYLYVGNGPLRDRALPVNILLKKEHYEHIQEFIEPKFDSNCGVELRNGEVLTNDQIHLNLIKQGRTASRGQIRRCDKVTKYLFFDYETVFDPADRMLLKPYSICWYIDDTINSEDYVFNPKMMNDVQYSVGFNCNDKFIESILEGSARGEKYILVGFNNSRFDNFLLANAALKLDALGHIFYVNNSILSMNITGGHTTFDLCRFLNTSLAKACKSFNTHPKKLVGDEALDHAVVQARYEKGEFKEWLKESLELLLDYNMKDVMSLCDLFHKTRVAIKKMTGDDMCKYMTIGQMTYKLWKKSLPHSLSVAAPKTHQEDKAIRQALIGGRCQNFRHVFKYEKPVRMVDVGSLYPYVMMTRQFPCGPYRSVDQYQEGKLGIYRVSIPSGAQPKCKIIPNRNKEGALDWDYEGEIQKNLTSVDIECMRLHGVEHTVHDGICWDKSSNDIFRPYLEPIKAEKVRQDSLENTPAYNGALRAMAKLFLNSLSGKVIQRNYADVTELVSNEKEFNQLRKKIKIDTMFQVSLSGSKALITGKKLDEDVYKRRYAKPSYLGVFIYAYARAHMYDTVLSKYDVIYMDTDSAALTLEDYQHFCKTYPELQGSEFGQYKEEVGEASKIITLAKKMYCIVNKEEPKKCKWRFKGVNLHKDKLCYINEKDYVDAGKKKNIQLLLHQAYQKLPYIDKEDLFDYAYDKWIKKPEPEPIYLICSQLRKELYKRASFLNLRQVYLLKRMVPKQGHAAPVPPASV